MRQAAAVPVSIAAPMAGASPIEAPWSWRPVPSWWCPLAASARSASAGATDVAGRCKSGPERFRAKWVPVRVKKTRQNKEARLRQNPASGGVLFDYFQTPESKGGGNSRPLAHSYQLRKQWRPNGPECQPRGQLYIGRQPP